MLEANRGFDVGAATLQPQVRVGMRQDGGEVDSGFGMEVGGGLTYAAGLNPGGYGYGSRRIDAEIGYGVGAWDDRELVTPYARVVLSGQPGAAYFPAAGMVDPIAMTPFEASNRGIYGYQLGGRLRLGPDLAASIEVGRGAGAPGSGAAHRAAVSLSMRW